MAVSTRRRRQPPKLQVGIGGNPVARALTAFGALLAPQVDSVIKRPTTDDELWEMVRHYTGLILPRKAVCQGHTAPFDAFKAAFNADPRMVVFHASRGFGGKTTMLAALGFLESAVLGAEVAILGGSGQQSERVHASLDQFWSHPVAPRALLLKDPTMFKTELINGGKVTALLASTKSARGPHPQRLLLDECDEMSKIVFDASMGQTMSKRGIPAGTVMSSTHQYADGMMTEILKRAHENDWPVYEWCYRENLTTNGGWLDPADVEGKKTEVTQVMWDTEYELQEPDPGARAIVTEAVEAMFRKELGEFAGSAREAIQIEDYVGNGLYATGADWAKKQDWTIVATLRYDVYPARFVAFERSGRRRWQEMAGILNRRVHDFPGRAAHDATGVGDVVSDLLTVPADDIIFSGTGQLRKAILSEYIAAIESGDLICPFIEWAYGEHKYATWDSVFGGQHLPDTICAMALAWYAARHLPKRDQHQETMLDDDFMEEISPF